MGSDLGEGYPLPWRSGVGDHLRGGVDLVVEYPPPFEVLAAWMEWDSILLHVCLAAWGLDLWGGLLVRVRGRPYGIILGFVRYCNLLRLVADEPMAFTGTRRRDRLVIAVDIAS